jgi:hypothetical protein
MLVILPSLASFFNALSIADLIVRPFLSMLLQMSEALVGRTQPRWSCDIYSIVPQGSAQRATLGCGTESRWDSQKTDE